MPISNYSRFDNGLNVAGMNVLNTYGGTIYWVDSGATNASDSNKGTYKFPCATIDGAINKCTADNGDIIMVVAGHSETVTTSIAADVAGITIVGLGNGDNRPALVGPNADATIDISANNIAIKNIQFTADAGTTQAATQKLNITGTYCTVDSCTFFAGAYDDVLINVAYTADYATIENCDFHVSANGPDVAIQLEGATGGNALTNVVIRNNFFDGGSATNSWDEGVICSSGVHTNGWIEGNRFLFMSGGIGGIQFTAAATGVIANNFLGGGTQDQMIDPGSYYCFENYESDTIDASGLLFPDVTT
jgi:hypothetical protein